MLQMPGTTYQDSGAAPGIMQRLLHLVTLQEATSVLRYQLEPPASLTSDAQSAATIRSPTLRSPEAISHLLFIQESCVTEAASHTGVSLSPCKSV